MAQSSFSSPANEITMLYVYVIAIVLPDSCYKENVGHYSLDLSDKHFCTLKPNVCLLIELTQKQLSKMK